MKFFTATVLCLLFSSFSYAEENKVIPYSSFFELLADSKSEDVAKSLQSDPHTAIPDHHSCARVISKVSSSLRISGIECTLSFIEPSTLEDTVYLLDPEEKVTLDAEKREVTLPAKLFNQLIGK